MTISPEALEAIGAEHEASEREIASLRRQRQAMGERIALLRTEANELELRLSVANTQHRLAEWNLLLRVRKMEELVTALGDACNRMANHQQGLPTRDEFEILKNDYYAHSAREG